MSFEDRGIYIDLLALAWDSEEPGSLVLPIPGYNPRTIRSFLLRWPSTFVSTGAERGLNLTPTEAERRLKSSRKESERYLKFTNLKLKDQWVKMSQFQEKASDRGKKGANARWYRNHASSIEQAMLNDGSASASSSASAFASNTSTNINGGSTTHLAFTDRENHARAFFQIFWIPYPKKIDEAGTFTSWCGMSPIDQEKAAESIAGWVACEQWQEHRYVPNPKRFLKERMWEAVPPQNGASNGTRQTSREQQRIERAKQALENVFGNSSGVAGTLRGDLSGPSNGRNSDSLSGNSQEHKPGNLEQGVSSSRADVQVPSDTGGSPRSRKH